MLVHRGQLAPCTCALFPFETDPFPPQGAFGPLHSVRNEKWVLCALSTTALRRLPTKQLRGSQALCRLAGFKCQRLDHNSEPPAAFDGFPRLMSTFQCRASCIFLFKSSCKTWCCVDIDIAALVVVMVRKSLQLFAAESGGRFLPMNKTLQTGLGLFPETAKAPSYMEHVFLFDQGLHGVPL